MFLYFVFYCMTISSHCYTVTYYIWSYYVVIHFKVHTFVMRISLFCVYGYLIIILTQLAQNKKIIWSQANYENMTTCMKQGLVSLEPLVMLLHLGFSYLLLWFKYIFLIVFWDIFILGPVISLKISKYSRFTWIQTSWSFYIIRRDATCPCCTTSNMHVQSDVQNTVLFTLVLP